MSLIDANETDIREEIAAPFLETLGYRRGTENDILREFALSYEHFFLGRKKKSDPPLRGRPDYVLTVAGSARWVLEVKAPSEDITLDVVEQAISYTRIPQISAAYAVILNGRRIVVFHYSQKSTDDPIVDLTVESGAETAAKLAGLLSPTAIRRDCSPPIVDLSSPLAPGFRSSARVLRGSITYSDCDWGANIVLPQAVQQNLDEVCKGIRGLRATVVGGRIWRDESSRIRAQVEWAVPHENMIKFVEDKKFSEIEYVSLGTIVSSDPLCPTIFDAVGSINIAAGEPLFNVIRWETRTMDIDTCMNFRGQAFGHVADCRFEGQLQVEYEQIFPAAPNVRISTFLVGKFELILDPN